MKSCRDLRAKAGMSLVEALVVLALTGLGLALLTSLFLVSSRLTTSSVSRADDHAQRLKALVEMRQILTASPASGLSITYPAGSPEVGDLAFSALTNRHEGQAEQVFEDQSLEPLYQGYQVVFWDAGDEAVYRRYLPLDEDPTTVARPLPESLLLASRQSADSERLLSKVSSLEFVDPTTGERREQWANPVRLRLQQLSAAGAPVAAEILIKSLRP